MSTLPFAEIRRKTEPSPAPQFKFFNTEAGKGLSKMGIQFNTLVSSRLRSFWLKTQNLGGGGGVEGLSFLLVAEGEGAHIM